MNHREEVSIAGASSSYKGEQEKAVLTHLRLHGLCGEWKALPRALCRGCAWNGDASARIGIGLYPYRQEFGEVGVRAPS